MLLVLLLVASLLPTSAGAADGAGAPFPPPEDRVPDQVLVRFQDGVPEAARERVLANVGAKTRSVIDQLDVHVARVPGHVAERAVAALQRNPLVEYAEFDTIIELDEVTEVVPNDPEWSRQWGPRKVNAPEAWARSKGHRDVVIAILDTGVTPVDDLKDKLLPGWNVLTGTRDTEDNQGHGTWSAGVAGASTDNGVAVAGYCWDCSLLPVKVLDGSSGSMSSLVAGITWATDNGADVISMSLSGASGGNSLGDAVRYAAGRGVVLTAAAGNQSDTALRYPAAYAEVIAVAGTDANDQLYSWSNYGDWVDVSAPGNNITTTSSGGTINYGGTSAATPAVAGIVGLGLSQGSAAEVRDALQATAAPLSFVRYGRVDANGMLTALGVGAGEPTNPEPDPEGPAADFSFTCLDLACSFDDGSTAGDAPVVAWSWQFGDGGAAGVSSVIHTYAEAGSYTVVLTAVDANGLSDSVAKVVSVTASEPEPDPMTEPDPDPDQEPEPDPAPDPDPEPGPDPVEPEVSLQVTTSKTRGLNIADLTWDGAQVDTVDVYVDGERLTSISDRTVFRHETGLRGNPSVRYQVCEAVAGGNCSDELTVSSW